ncbi:YbfB/YjiJ family MFS transporter [Variovorax sp. LT1R16]|uniref:YbfB/YjiJ family MFS transporter n=1 Tax=Variovorax sp. LT1R16 TaxID=3443728 RepID=UPI003F4655C2
MTTSITHGRRKNNSNVRSALEAALILAVGMGFGRFAFTAVYPHMITEGVLSLRGGSYAATANYAGYLIGAILSVRAQARNAHQVCLWSVIGTSACLMVLAVLTQTWAIVAVRGLAGMFSSLSMVASSLWLLERRGHHRGAPLLFAGVGVGIAISAELLVLAAYIGMDSSGMWIMLGVIGLLVGLLAAPGLVASGKQTLQAASAVTSLAQAPVAAWPLVAIYGLAGVGYIVTATYLPLLVKTALPHLDAAHVWAVFGLGAAPSCFFWHRVHGRLGTRAALQVNLLIQAVGVALPALNQSPAAYLLSALLVGGTFMGTVTIAMPAAQHAARASGTNLMATMTLVYGVGQIFGPVVADFLYAHSHSFSTSLVAAAGALVVAAAVALAL